jgi:hypothetical protein
VVSCEWSLQNLRPHISLLFATKNGVSCCRNSIAESPPFVSITRDQLVAFFAWLQDEYMCVANGHIQRKPIHLSPKTILNIHVALSALWTWAVNEGPVEKNILGHCGILSIPKFAALPLRGALE